MAATGEVGLDHDAYTDLTTAGVPADGIIQARGGDVSIIVATSLPAATAVGFIYKNGNPMSDARLPVINTGGGEEYYGRSLNTREGSGAVKITYGSPP